MKTLFATLTAAIFALTLVFAPIVQADQSKDKVAKTYTAEFPAKWFWGDESEQAKLNELVGKPAPPLYLTDWIGDKKSLKERKGEIVVVDFWGTWCGPCLAAIPHTNKLLSKYKDQGVDVLAVCNTRGSETMAEVTNDKNIEYTTAKDVNDQSKEAWNVMWWPTFALVDRDGVLRAIGLQTDHVEDALRELLKEQPASTKSKE